MKYFSIPEPCNEKWNEMTPTDRGAFCRKCSKEVHDVSAMSNDEIIGLMASSQQMPCMRMRNEQEVSLNLAIRDRFLSKKRHMQRAMLFSLLVVFGFTLFSCNNSQQIHERNLLQSAAEIIVEVSETVSFPIAEEKPMDEDTHAIQQQKATEAPDVPKHEEVLFLGQPAISREEQAASVKVSITESEITSIPSIDHLYHTAGVPVMIYEGEIAELVTFPGELDASLQSSTERDLSIPETFSALTFPNPATIETRLEVKIPNDTERLGIRLLSTTGEILQEINDKEATAGVHEFRINTMHLQPAYYLIDVRYNDQHEVVRFSKVQ